MTFTGNTINVSGKGLASTVALALAKSFYDNINSESCRLLWLCVATVIFYKSQFIQFHC